MRPRLQPIIMRSAAPSESVQRVDRWSQRWTSEAMRGPVTNADQSGSPTMPDHADELTMDSPRGCCGYHHDGPRCAIMGDSSLKPGLQPRCRWCKCFVSKVTEPVSRTVKGVRDGEIAWRTFTQLLCPTCANSWCIDRPWNRAATEAETANV